MTSRVEELRESIVAQVASSPAILSHLVAEQFVDDLISAAKQEGVVEYLVKKLMDTIEEGNVKMTNSLMAVRKCLDKLEADNDNS